MLEVGERGIMGRKERTGGDSKESETGKLGKLKFIGFKSGKNSYIMVRTQNGSYTPSWFGFNHEELK